MNDRLLFRGKAINRNDGFPKRLKLKNGDWVYGIISKIIPEQFIDKLPYEMTNEDGVCGIDIDYKTIGQCTGLKDKNGKLIYEGDIVLANCSTTAKPETIKRHKCLIQWDIRGFDLVVIDYEENAKWTTSYSVWGYQGNALEIIGNIHEEGVSHE